MGGEAGDLEVGGSRAMGYGMEDIHLGHIEAEFEAPAKTPIVKTPKSQTTMTFKSHFMAHRQLATI